MKSKWMSLTSGIPERWLLGSTPSNVFINDVDDGMECTLSKFKDGTRVGGALDKLDSWTGLLLRENSSGCRNGQTGT